MTLQADSTPLVFLLVILASVANWIFRAIKEKGNDAEAPRDLARPAPGTTEEERMRKFLEALGVPTEAPPPVQSPAPPLATRPPAPAIPTPMAAPQPTGRRFPRPGFDPQQGFPKGPMTRLPPEREPVAVEDFLAVPRKATAPVSPAAEFPSEPKLSRDRDEKSAFVSTSAQPVDAATVELADRFEAITNSSSADQTARETAATAGTSPAQWKALLHDRNELRKAIVLREIFGPPRSLQSLG